MLTLRLRQCSAEVGDAAQLEGCTVLFAQDVTHHLDSLTASQYIVIGQLLLDMVSKFT